MNANFVFDLDGAIAIGADYEREKTEKGIKEKFGIEYFTKHCLYVYNWPYYIFPGYYALFRWLHSKGERILFFSSGTEERNVELVDKLMKMSFGDSASEIGYKIFSRHHCIDTAEMERVESDKYQSCFLGQRKKKLSGIVVHEDELQNTLLIDDDNSYMVKGEEYNFIYVRYCYLYLQDTESIYSDPFHYFHRAYYLAGLFSKMFETMENNKVSLIEAAKYVQIDIEGKELNRDFQYPGIDRTEYYTKGLEILKQFDSTLEFYYE